MNIIYHNPNEHWISPLGDVQPEQAMMTGCFGGFIYIVFIFLFVCIMIALGGCTSQTKVITVPEVHSEHHWHTDSMIRHDSVTTEKTTTIRELDSAQMAEYGIKLKNAQRAWLIETNRLQRELSELRQNHTDTIHERDSIPYPVVKMVEKELSMWQKIRMHAGEAVLAILGGGVVWAIVRRRFFGG